MYIKQAPKRASRSGAAAVEFALVAPLLILLIFGVYEYGRFMFFWTTATNAARDGARFASVNTSTTMLSHSGANGYNALGVAGIVNAKMGGTQKYLTGYTVSVIAPLQGNGTGLKATPPTFSVDPALSNAEDWKNVPFPGQIAVQISGNYIPTVSVITKMNSTYPVAIRALQTVEN